MTVELRRRRFTVDEYDAMIDAGILTKDDRVELIEGEILQVSPIGSPHAACLSRLTHALVSQTGAAGSVRIQSPLRLSDLSEPEPDVALVRPRADFYAERHPRPEDTLLLVEVSHTTLGYDRGTKLPLYAAAGIPEVWIVDVDGGVVEVYREPSGRRYAAVERAGPGDVLRPEGLPDVAVAVEDVLG